MALGPEALESLAKEFPADETVAAKLAIAYHAHGRDTDALARVRALLARDAGNASSVEIVDLVSAIASRGQGDTDEQALALLEGSFGESGVDEIIELAARPHTFEPTTAFAEAAERQCSGRKRGG